MPVAPYVGIHNVTRDNNPKTGALRDMDSLGQESPASSQAVADLMWVDGRLSLDKTRA